MLHCNTQLILNVIHLLCKNLTSIMKITIVEFKILQKVEAVQYKQFTLVKKVDEV